MCGTNEAEMIDRHLKKQAKARRIANGKTLSTNLNDLKGVAEDPQPHGPTDPDDMRSDSGSASSDGDYDDAQEQIDNEFDMRLLKAEDEHFQVEGVVDRVLHDELMHKDRTMSKSYQIKVLTDTVRSLEARLRVLEAKDSDRDGTSNGSYDGSYPDDHFYQNGFGNANNGEDGQHFQDGNMMGAGGNFPMNPYGAVYPPMWPTAQPQQQHFEHNAEFDHHDGEPEEPEQDAQHCPLRDEVRTPEQNQGQPHWVEV
jgi:hypothetical protein